MTQDVGKIMSKLHQIKPKGCIDLVRGIKVANVTDLIIYFRDCRVTFRGLIVFLSLKARVETSSEQKPQTTHCDVHRKPGARRQERVDKIGQTIEEGKSERRHNQLWRRRSQQRRAKRVH